MTNDQPEGFFARVSDDIKGVGLFFAFALCLLWIPCYIYARFYRKLQGDVGWYAAGSSIVYGAAFVAWGVTCAAASSIPEVWTKGQYFMLVFEIGAVTLSFLLGLVFLERGDVFLNHIFDVEPTEGDVYSGAAVVLGFFAIELVILRFTIFAELFTNF